MSILIVAPRQPALATLDSEVAAIVRCFIRPILVQGDVTEADLQHALTDDIEGFWFAGHASERGLLLSNNYLLPVDALAQYLSSANIEWSFFNSCESGLFVSQLQSRFAHDCYAYITEIADIAAWRTASLVARNYSNVGNILQAVRQAAPAGTPLRYFPSLIGNGQRMSQRDLDSVQELSGQIAELTKVLAGDGRYQRSGLIDNVRHLEERLTSIMEEQARQRTWLLLNSVMMALVLIVELWLRVGA